MYYLIYPMLFFILHTCRTIGAFYQLFQTNEHVFRDSTGSHIKHYSRNHTENITSLGDGTSHLPKHNSTHDFLEYEGGINPKCVMYVDGAGNGVMHKTPFANGCLNEAGKYDKELLMLIQLYHANDTY